MIRVFCLSLLVVTIFTYGCDESKVKRKPTLGEDKMVRIHTDLLIANAAVANLYGPLRDSMLKIYQQQIFDSNAVGKDEYETNLRIYAEDIVALDSMYAKTKVILDSLERLKVE